MTRAATHARAGRRGLTVALLTGLAATGAVVGVAAPAQAHDYVVASSPADGAVVDAPLTEVSYTFNAPVLDLSGTGSSNVVEVIGPDGLHHETGCVATVDGPTASVGVALGAAGTYTSSYQVVSSDGHTVSDSQTFEYAPPAGTPETAGSPSRPSCDAASEPDGGAATGTEGSPSSGGATPGADASPGADGTSGADGTASAGPEADGTPSSDADGTVVAPAVVVGVAVAIVALALVAFLVLVLTGRRRRGADAGRPGPDEAGGAGDGTGA